MKSAGIRQSFLDYFAERGHRVYPSAPLVPHGDPTLLFTNAGMVQFKDFFTGAEKPAEKRAVSVQKCLRVSGKHNDLENVGPSSRHHTFFEMLGNFSFGDYFKEDAIRFAWELVTEVWGLERKHLFASVFREDDEAFDLWHKIAGLPDKRIQRCGEKDNFWAMGDTGPCGPCSEIFVDRHPDLPEASWDEGTDSGRYLEIWNLVFMQFLRAPNAVLTELPSPSIDTGAGLERVTAVLQGVDSNYDTDLFQPILLAAAELAGKSYGRDAGEDVSFRVIADHLRAVSFLLADGVIPGNEGRGYVLRRILRRAVRHGMRLGFTEPFVHRLVPVLGEVMGKAYPELGKTEPASVATLRAEEEKFLATVATASQRVQEAIEEAQRTGVRTLAGDTVFRFYDTYGLPLELIREIAEEERFGIDEQGFETALAGQRERSREVTGETQKRLGALRAQLREMGDTGRTLFEGQRWARDPEGPLPTGLAARVGEATAEEKLQVEGRVHRFIAESAGRGIVVTDRTPFYPESGGQVGDRGEMTWSDGAADVVDTQKENAGVVYHFVQIRAGTPDPGTEVVLRVDESLRRATERNHTATHLLHAALHEVIGAGARQAGSLVAADRLRFDFTHGHGLSPAELRRVEDLVNEWIRRATPVDIQWRSYRDAVAAGAMALFGEKYGERVRTVAVPGVSLELCGGCHVRNTGEIGLFLITAEKGIASGVRRIEALTGSGALASVRQREQLLEQVAAELAVPAERAAKEASALRDRLRETEKELSGLRVKLVSASGGDAGSEAALVSGVKVLAREVPPAPANELRNLADVLRAKLGSGVVVLGSRDHGKVSLVAAVTSDLVGRLHAGEIVKRIAPIVGGTGGGRPDFAQAGGKEPEKLPQALAAVVDAVREALGGS